MAEQVARVAQRCEDAKTTEFLDLSNCELTQIPHAVFFLMKETTIRQCNFNGNLLKHIPVKFAQEFSSVEDVSLSLNRLSILPENFSQLGQLKTLHLDGNCLTGIENTLLSLPSLEILSLKSNKIKDVDADAISSSSSLKEIHLQENPLSQTTLDSLRSVTNSTVFT